MHEGSLSVRIADWLLTRTGWVALLLGLLVAASVASMPFLHIVVGWDSFYDRTTAEQHQFDEVNAQFVGDDILYIGYESPDPFSNRALSSVRKLEEAIGNLTLPAADGHPVPVVVDSKSLASVKDVVGSESTFRSSPLVEDPIPEDPAALAHIRERALANPLISGGRLLSNDGRVGSLAVRLSAELTEAQKATSVDRMRALISEAQKNGDPSAYHLTGKSAVVGDTGRYTQQNVQQFVPIVYLVIMLLLFVFVRRALGLLLALVNVTLCFLAGLASLVWVGGAIDDLSSSLPCIVMILSVVSIVHFVSDLAKNAREFGDERAPRITFIELMRPSFMCAVTTSVGFLSLASSQVPALRSFGLGVGLSVMLSLVITFLLVALAVKWKPPSAFISPRAMAVSGRFEGLVDWYTHFVIRHYKTLLVAGVALFAFTSFGIARLHVDTNHLEYFSPTAPVRIDTSFVESKLGGTTTVIASIRSSEQGRFLEPAVLRRLDELESFARSELGADDVISVVDYLKVAHRAFFNEDSAYARVPDNRSQVAQMMLMLNDPSLSEYIDPSRGWVRVVIRLKEHGAAKMAGLFGKLDGFLQQRFPAAEGYETHSTGESRLMLSLNQMLVSSQTSSLSLSFLLIFLPILVMFRSVKATLFAVPSNLFPIGLTLGLMGWLNIPLNVATICIAAITLGIAVDDTLHFIEYLRQRLTEHGDVERGLRETFKMKGTSVLWAALVISMGFFVCGFSGFLPIRQFGFLTGFAMVTGIVGELFILPPLLLVTRSRLGTRVAPAASKAPTVVAAPVS
jgi:predicted RND superfamily exporter protein